MSRAQKANQIVQAPDSIRCEDENCTTASARRALVVCVAIFIRDSITIQQNQHPEALHPTSTQACFNSGLEASWLKARRRGHGRSGEPKVDWAER